MLVAVSVGLTWITYGCVLDFPFLFDDLIHLRWLQGRSLFSEWTNLEGMQHYRPLVISLWALSQRLFGAQNAVPLHWLTLLIHALNGILIGLLARDVTDKEWAAPLASALFVTFPFSYQAIPSPGSLSKPVSTLLILAAALAYSQGRILGRRRLIWAAGALSILCPFAYEAGSLAGFYLILIEFLLWHTGKTERWFRGVWLAPLAALPFLLAWYHVPQTGRPITFPGWEALWQSSVYFVQGLTWPLALLAKPLMRWADLSDGIATALVGYLAMSLIVNIYWQRRRMAILFFVLGWYFLSLGVQWVTLSFRYVIDGPRLLYAGSVAVAILWADLVTPHKAWGVVYRRIGLWVGVLTVLAMSAWGVSFARERMVLCKETLNLLEDASRQAIAAGPEERLLFLNLPSWFAPNEAGFALGHEGYTVMPPYYDIGLKDFLSVNYGEERWIVERGFADVRQEWCAKLGYHGPEGGPDETAQAARDANRVYVIAYGERDLTTRYAGGLQEQGASSEGSFRALYAEHVALAQAKVHREADQIVVMLDWRCLSKLEEPYTVFVHLYSSDGVLVGQDDGIPVGGTLPFVHWKPGDSVRDVRYLPLPAEQEGAFVGVGLYRNDTGERAKAIDGTGQRLPDDTWRMALE